MRRGHGDADALYADSFDTERFDRLVADGGAGDEAAAARAVLTNRLLGPGRFGKLFPDLPAFRPPDDDLVALGRSMKESAPEDPALNSSDVEAGFTYLGQFVDHDMTADKTAGFFVFDDPEDIEQARTPNFDLDSLYGGGPAGQPSLYQPGVPRSRAAFRIGRTAPGETPGGQGAIPPVPGGRRHDLPRAANGRALLGDDRNDENLVVAQLHLQFLKFHNRVLHSLGAGRDEGEPRRFSLAEEARGRGVPFFRARRAVRWHYQWIVLEELLPRLVDETVLRDVREGGRRYFTFDRYGGSPFMPLEFSGAAYRLGHSMIRETYDFNRVFARPEVEPNALTEATLSLLFSFTGNGGGAPIPGNWAADWTRFFDFGDRGRVNMARRFDTRLIPQLHQLPGPAASPELASLAVRNLVRGSRIGLPSAQAVAEAMQVEAIAPDDLARDQPLAVTEGRFHHETPLWWYVLREAELQTGGARLGAIGSRIVAEVIVGLLEADRFSYLRQAEPGWAPGKPDPAGIVIPVATPGRFTMPDLLRYVNEFNPLG
jgi:hypothetical protein